MYQSSSGAAAGGESGGVKSSKNPNSTSTPSSSAHLLQMQRMLAANNQRNNRSNFYDGANYGDMEFARQLQQQHNRSFQHQNSWGREEFMTPPMLSPMVAAAAAAATSNYGGGRSSSSNDYMAGMSAAMRGMSPYVFKCPDCAFNKSSCEDLEIHIKMEHLNWFPFQCPFCHQNRASDSQMREHIHSVHKKPENKYLYVDNVVAKRTLQEMIDRALFGVSLNANASMPNTTSMRGAMSGRSGAFANGGFPFASNHSNSNGMFSNPFTPNYLMNGIESGLSPSAHQHQMSYGRDSSPTRRQAKSSMPNNNNAASNGYIGGATAQCRNSNLQDNSGTIDDAASRRSNNSAQLSDDYDAENGSGGSTTGVTVLAKKTSSGDDLLAQLQQQITDSKSRNNNANEGDSTGEVIDEMEDEQNCRRSTNHFGNNSNGDIFGNGNDGCGEDETLDDETSAQLSHIFGPSHGIMPNVKSEFDMSVGENGSQMDNSAVELSGLNFVASRSTDLPTSISDELEMMKAGKSHQDVLQNLSAIFSAANGGGALPVDTMKLGSAQGGSMFGNGNRPHSPIRLNHNNNPIRRRAPRGCGSNQSISKKRVLGECASCHKPVTAGARQMHMFFHLGKDYNTYRFRCKHPNCGVEHYRKDQMENHHSKIHGKIEAEMMEDRSQELHEMCQKISMELLGTVGNTPGPTAAKAQQMYDEMLKETEMAALRKRKRNRNSAGNSYLLSNYYGTEQSGDVMRTPSAGFNSRNGFSTTKTTTPITGNYNNKNNILYSSANSHNSSNLTGVNNDFLRSIQQQINQQKVTQPSGNNNNKTFGINNNNSNNNSFSGNLKNTINADPRHEESIECQMCRKSIVSRTRGFHILRHLNTDLGIIRYVCKYCEFKHDRPQSVSTHGKKEHNDEECVRDLINNYEEEVKSMSKACFGREQLFAKEERRRRIERSERVLAEQELLGLGQSKISVPPQQNTVTGVDESYEDEEESNNEVSIEEAALSSTEGNNYSTYTTATTMPVVQSIEVDGTQVPRNVVKISLSKISAALSDESSPISRQTISSTLTHPLPASCSSKRKNSSRRFGMRRQKSRKQREDMAKLREVSMRLGGAQYFKRKSIESIPCEKCGKFITSRLSQHAYSHLEDFHLYLCTQCNLGHFSRDVVAKHLKEVHNKVEAPTDNRLKYAREIKEAIRGCFPSCFVDAPIPTPADIERLKANLNLSDKALATFDAENEPEVDENEEDLMDEDSVEVVEHKRPAQLIQSPLAILLAAEDNSAADVLTHNNNNNNNDNEDDEAIDDSNANNNDADDGGGVNKNVKEETEEIEAVISAAIGLENEDEDEDGRSQSQFSFE